MKVFINYSYKENGKVILTLPMLRLLSFKAQGCNDFWKPSKPCHVGIHWIALADYSQIRTLVLRFQLFKGVMHSFVMAKLASSRIRVNIVNHAHYA